MGEIIEKKPKTISILDGNIIVRHNALLNGIEELPADESYSWDSLQLRPDWDYRWIRGKLNGELDRERIKRASQEGWQIVSIINYPALSSLSDHPQFLVKGSLVLCCKPKPLNILEMEGDWRPATRVDAPELENVDMTWLPGVVSLSVQQSNNGEANGR